MIHILLQFFSSQCWFCQIINKFKLTSAGNVLSSPYLKIPSKWSSVNWCLLRYILSRESISIYWYKRKIQNVGCRCKSWYNYQELDIYADDPTITQHLSQYTNSWSFLCFTWTLSTQWKTQLFIRIFIFCFDLTEK